MFIKITPQRISKNKVKLIFATAVTLLSSPFDPSFAINYSFSQARTLIVFPHLLHSGICTGISLFYSSQIIH